MPGTKNMNDTFDTLINAEQARDQLGNPNWRFLDCQFDLMDSNAGFQKYSTAHIPNALFVDLNNDVGSKPSSETGRHPLPNIKEFARKIGNWGIDNNTQVVICDGNGGMAASRLWWALRWLGHTRVAVLNGGLIHWQSLGLPIINDTVSVEARQFTPNINQHMVVNTENIIAVQRQGHALLDARSPERYRGEQEPIDPVAGHIPGALNYFQSNNLQENGLFKDKSDLQKQISNVIGTIAASKVIHYCGSGVSACHNILAMEYAGMTGSKLYPGSWSEWITDPKRPIATTS